MKALNNIRESGQVTKGEGPVGGPGSAGGQR